MAGFYADHPEEALLLGDIVTGFQSVIPHLHRPDADDEKVELGITITRPSYFAVMTPCCSIGGQQIMLAPLLPIRLSFLSNPYFQEDLTRINRRGPGNKMISPADFNRLGPEERQAAIEGGDKFGLLNLFVYAAHDRLKKYSIPGKGSPVETGHYMIEFGNAFRINCDALQGKPAPRLTTKFLELSVESRNELREKLKFYYGRIPKEDEAALAAKA